MYVKKFTVSVKYKKDAHKRKLVPFFLPHGIAPECRLAQFRCCHLLHRRKYICKIYYYVKYVYQYECIFYVGIFSVPLPYRKTQKSENRQVVALDSYT